MKNITIGIVAIAILGFGIYLFTRDSSGKTPVEQVPAATESTSTPATSETKDYTQDVIGSSVEGRDIVAYHFGKGTKEILLVGGIHGGYEWNTALLGQEVVDYLIKNPVVIPASLRVTVVPVLNPDGLNKVVGTTGAFTEKDVSKSDATVVAGRFNAHDVDLNRNFDCDWQAKGTWQNKTVSGGASAFSEPESQAIRDYIKDHKPTAAVVWYSSAGGVYASSCHNGVSSDTEAITDIFAKASGYPAYESFDFYATTGDMVNWFAKNNIAAISVLLTNHSDTEFSKNQAGLLALFDHYK